MEKFVYNLYNVMGAFTSGNKYGIHFHYPDKEDLGIAFFVSAEEASRQVCKLLDLEVPKGRTAIDFLLELKNASQTIREDLELVHVSDLKKDMCRLAFGSLYFDSNSKLDFKQLDGLTANEFMFLSEAVGDQLKHNAIRDGVIGIVVEVRVDGEPEPERSESELQHDIIKLCETIAMNNDNTLLFAAEEPVHAAAVEKGLVQISNYKYLALTDRAFSMYPFLHNMKR